MEIGTMISGDWFVDVSSMVCVSDMVDVSGMYWLVWCEVLVDGTVCDKWTLCWWIR